jgi:quercetin dioxygenase-like cupin family protein
MTWRDGSDLEQHDRLMRVVDGGQTVSNGMERREFCRVVGVIPFLGMLGSASEAAVAAWQASTGKSQVVAAGQDRTGTPVAMGFSTLDFKVSGQQTNGGLFIMEHVGLGKGGGPVRHLHHEQEEWFYVLEGEVVAEVGGKRFRLKTGDSVFAPRKVPHGFVYVAEKPGRLLIAFTPAGKMEAYFREGHGFDPQSLAKYGMEYVGPALTLEEAARVGG